MLHFLVENTGWRFYSEHSIREKVGHNILSSVHLNMVALIEKDKNLSIDNPIGQRLLAFLFPLNTSLKTTRSTCLHTLLCCHPRISTA